MQWLKRAYDSVGLTQYPVGPHLTEVQAQFGGSVILCLDVSGSMTGSPLAHAVEGCRLFLTEAIDAGYSVGGVLWHHDVARATSTVSRLRQEADDLFVTASAGGGNDIVPTLLHCETLLEGRDGDRVIAIFGDGDLGSAERARTEAERLLAKNIRVITCGLGNASAEQLAVISSEKVAPRVAQTDDIAGAIAGMASGLKRR